MFVFIGSLHLQAEDAGFGAEWVVVERGISRAPKNITPFSRSP